MFHTLVIPLDGTDFAAHALDVGIALATRASAPVRVIGVAPTDAELAWTYDHVHDDAKHAGIDAGDVEVRVDPEPVDVLLDVAAVDGNVLCLASHDLVPPAAKLLHAVASKVIVQAQHPLVVVGGQATTGPLGTDVVVALDGVTDPMRLLDVAAAWALQLESRLRIVTVYELGAPDPFQPERTQRHHGPPIDPDAYLAAMRRRVANVDLVGVDTVAVEDGFSVSRGLAQHLAEAPAQILVLGGHRERPPSVGVARHLLTTAPVPLLIVNGSG